MNDKTVRIMHYPLQNGLIYFQEPISALYIEKSKNSITANLFEISK